MDLFTDDKGKDQGINVRQRAKDLLALINDDSNLREERKKAKKNRDKYIGVSSEGNVLRLTDAYLNLKSL